MQKSREDCTINREKLQKVLTSSKEYCYEQQKECLYWNFAVCFGEFQSSQYYLALRFLNRLEGSKFNTKIFKEILLRSQRSDGGWHQIADPSNVNSHLDTTIFNYWFLKASKSLEITDRRMINARKFILDNGGLQSANYFTKISLCLLGNYEWDAILPIPLFQFRNDSIYKYTSIKPWVGQWVLPHLLPIAYLRYFRIQKFLGDEFDVSELNGPIVIKVVDHRNKKKRKNEPCSNVRHLFEKMQQTRRPCGTYGAYRGSTLFALAVLDDWNENFGSVDKKLDFNDDEWNNIEKSLKTIENLCFSCDDLAYSGVYADCRWRDTMIVTLSLLECDANECDRLKVVVKHLLKKSWIDKYGAVSYGVEFEFAPETDATALFAIILARFFKSEHAYELGRANQWLVSMQNADGGFGAFKKNVNDFWLIRFLAMEFLSCGEIFDCSSADITGRVLEAWAEFGFTMKDKHVKKAINYLMCTQTKFGAWEGRWGVNYIYGVSAVVPAVAKIAGVDLMQMKWVLKSIDWLVSIQNDDGGFGESTLSYTDDKWIGKGVSTPTQTAWAILALIEAKKVGYLTTDCLERAVKYLLNEFRADEKRWYDDSSVATFHRKLLYIHYPVYAIGWPMIALGRYRNFFNSFNSNDTLITYC